ncbi:DUF6502 family protein [Thiomicrorhabdus aquaedulcis]|uniref:DUF6502 family protein n=1 Tax=Thiomicrorhabdus aquaedulcis TaxID=2211106 RepID=UPI00187F3CF4|nr:DUF6502 family protein [Thiomicrorhabdus aquaedulcis]
MENSHTLNGQQTALFKALKSILKPLVAMLLRQGVTFTALTDLLKITYVEVADSQFKLAGKAQTDSRISVLTGVHRKEVKRIRELAEESMQPKEKKASLSAQLMATWLGQSAYLLANGQPKPLLRLQNSEDVSFESLVRCVTRDVHPRSILDEWLHQGVAALDAQDRVVLQQTGYVPDHDFEEKLFFTGKNIGDHLSAVAHNLAPATLLGQTPAMFDRAVYYNDLSAESVQALEVFAKQESTKLLTQVNKMASQLQGQSQGQAPSQSGYAMHFGAYFYHDLTPIPTPIPAPIIAADSAESSPV